MSCCSWFVSSENGCSSHFIPSSYRDLLLSWLVLILNYWLNYYFITRDCIVTKFREKTIMKTSGDKYNKTRYPVSWSWNLLPHHRQVNCNARSREKLVTDFALAFRCDLRWIILPYKFYVIMKNIANLQHLLWLCQSNDSVQCSFFFAFFRMLPGISGQQCS